MGSRLVSYKGDAWRGRTTLATSDRGDRRMVRIENGYVSTDGSEIRSFPGWRTLIDLSEANNPDGGYARYIIDAMRPVMNVPTPADFYTSVYDGTDATKTQTLRCRAKPVYLEWFEQAGGVITIGGVTRFRECPLLDEITRTPVTVTGVRSLGGSLVFELSGSINDNSLADSLGVGLNGINLLRSVLYVEGVTVSDAALQADLDANVNGRVHEIKAVGAVDIQIRTLFASFNGDAVVAATGDISVVRPNRDNSYPTPTGADPYDPSLEARIDDLNALTTWRIIPTLPLSASNSTDHECYPAFVANRKRDFADEPNVFVEGITVGTLRGISRREQRELPHRMLPEVAGDRIIIAAPGYNCLFQVPLMVPVNPDNWPATPTTEGLGIRWFGNDQYDQPRSLGLPKARLVDSPFTPAPGSPGITQDEEDVTHLLTAFVSSPQHSFPPGTYRLCITYADSVTQDEGEPSEPIEFTIPNNDYCYLVNLTYMHPGYIMPECLADKINVYMTDVDSEQFGFYKTLDLRHRTGELDHLGFALDTVNNFSPQTMSAKYGMSAGNGSSDTLNAREWNTLRMPMARQAGATIGDSIDFERPPLFNGMPRGASCARYIRGVLVAGGHIGTEGPTKSLHKGYGSVRFGGQSSTYFGDDSTIYLRQHTEADLLAPADGELGDGFGVASRNFPDAYQGISALSERLLAENMGREIQIEKVVNRVSALRPSQAEDFGRITDERLKTVRPVVDVDYRESPSAPDAPDFNSVDASFFWRVLKGQVQIGDTGLPSRVTKAGGRGIQIIDYNKDDDITAIWQLAGNAIICSRYETYFLSWQTFPLGQTPTLVNSEYGCIAPNSMVEFDGGVAWISERGPVAIGSSLQFVGADIEEDFIGQSRKYQTDSQGMMRHTWSCHDSARGLVMWGMRTSVFKPINDGRGSITFTGLADDGVFGRAACDEVLIWSYRTNSFSTWRPPAGMEVLWMRQIQVRDDFNTASGTMRVAFLCDDGRIYMLDDQACDTNAACLTLPAASHGAASTTLVLQGSSFVTDGVTNGGPAGRKGSSFLIRVDQTVNSNPNYSIPGSIVEAFDDDNQIVWSTTVQSADPATQTIVLAEAKTWSKGQSIRIGVRQPMVIETTALGAEFLMNGHVKEAQVRYTLRGSGRCNAKVELLKSDLDTTTGPDTIALSDPAAWTDLGATVSTDRHSRRRAIPTDTTAPEIAMRITVSSEAQVRIADLSLELV